MSSVMGNVIIPGWKTVIADKDRQWEFDTLCQYIDSPDIQMRLIDVWEFIEFESEEAELLYYVKTDEPGIIELLTRDSTWKFGFHGWEQDGDWIKIYPHSVDVETRAWIKEKYGVSA